VVGVLVLGVPTQEGMVVPAVAVVLRMVEQIRVALVILLQLAQPKALMVVLGVAQVGPVMVQAVVEVEQLLLEQPGVVILVAQVVQEHQTA
tara:strand:- start:381 stop:653 length:273 start_codon:yes stop_codon:yes gene_type:complete